MSGATNGAQPIDPRPAAPPRISLLTSAIDETTNAAPWQNGIRFNPEHCRDDDSQVWWTCPVLTGVTAGLEPTSPFALTGGSKTIPGTLPEVDYRPWMAWSGDKCSPFQERDYQGRARRKLQAAETRKMERELWRGDIATDAQFPNEFLANPLTVTDLTPASGSSPLVYALGELQQALADTQDERGMIHATRRTVNLWQSEFVVRREGNLLLDVFDNIIIPGVGYDGSSPQDVIDPTGETQFAYATGMVVTMRGDIRIIPDNFEEATDRIDNLVEFRAERPVAAFWDLCSHFAINVDLCEPCCIPEGSVEVLSVAPPSGPAAGGTAVTITGNGFSGVTNVDFGPNPAAGFVVVNATTITATTPAGVGVVDVVVTQPSGTGTLPNGFTYT